MITQELTAEYRTTVDELMRLKKIKRMALSDRETRSIENASIQLSEKLQKLFTISQQLDSGALTEERIKEMEINDEMNKEVFAKVNSMEEMMKTIMVREATRPITVQLDSIHIQEAGLKHIEERFDQKFLAVDNRIASVDQMIQEKFSDVIDALDYTKRAYAGSVNLLKSELLGLLQKGADQSDENVKTLTDLINSKVYDPQITVEANTGEILSELRSISSQLLQSNNGIEVSIEEILTELKTKHKWKFDVQRNSDKLITGAIATEI